MINKKYKIQWKKGNTIRYYVNGTGIEVQIGKYRGLDEFDKAMRTKPTWQGKWYVDVFNYGKPKLFNTQIQANKYLKIILNKLYKTKQLKKKK